MKNSIVTEIVIVFALIFISCGSPSNRIEIKSIHTQKDFKDVYNTDIYINDKYFQTVDGNTILKIFNEDKSRAVIQCVYAGKNYHQICDIWLVDSKTKRMDKIFSDLPVEFKADEDLNNLLVIDDTNESDDRVHVFVFNLIKKEITAEMFIPKPAGGYYSLQKAEYSNGEFKFKLYNDVEISDWYSISIR